MTDFNDLQQIWELQSNPQSTITASSLILKAEENIKTIKRKHQGTIAILSISVLILIAYYIYTWNAHWSLFSTGLCMMTGMLLLRIGIELVSARRFRTINPVNSTADYSQQIIAFYEWRKKIHFILTPIIYISYTIGFVLILPALKANLSYGFYLYCLISGFLSLIVLVFIIYGQIKKELKLIRFLKSVRGN